MVAQQQPGGTTAVSPPLPCRIIQRPPAEHVHVSTGSCQQPCNQPFLQFQLQRYPSALVPSSRPRRQGGSPIITAACAALQARPAMHPMPPCSHHHHHHNSPAQPPPTMLTGPPQAHLTDACHWLAGEAASAVLSWQPPWQMPPSDAALPQTEPRDSPPKANTPLHSAPAAAATGCCCSKTPGCA